MKCAIDDCPEMGVYRPKLLLFAPSHYGEHEPATVELPLVVCGFHKRRISVEDVLTEQTKKTIADAMRSRGFVSPDFPKSKLEWVPIESYPAEGTPAAQ